MLTIVVKSLVEASLDGTEWIEEYVGRDTKVALDCVRNLRLMDEVLDIDVGFYQEFAGAQLIWTDAVANGTSIIANAIDLSDDDLSY